MAARWRNLGCALLAVLATLPAAAAQGVDIRVDPDSPSATEYQLPLERARQDAQQGGPPSSVKPGARTAPAFGEGIKPKAKTGNAEHNGGAPTSTGTRADPTTSTTTTPQGTDGATAYAPLREPAPTKVADGPGSLLVEVGAIAAGVLLLGGAIGLLLRRRSAGG